MKNRLLLPALLLASLLTLAVTAQAVCDPGAGWCPPTTSPPYPAGSVPLNTGSVAQTKAGDLLINGAAGFANGLGLLLGGLQLKITQAIPEGGAPSDIVPVGPISKGMLLVATTSLGDAQWMATSTLGLGGGGGTNYWTQTQVGTSTTFLLFPTATTTSVGIGTLSPTTGKLVVSGGNVDVTNNKLINLNTPTASSDAATKGYVDAQSTGGGGIFPVYGTTTCPTGWSKAYDGYITTFTVGVPNTGVTGSSLCVQQSAIIAISGYSQVYTSGLWPGTSYNRGGTDSLVCAMCYK